MCSCITGMERNHGAQYRGERRNRSPKVGAEYVIVSKDRSFEAANDFWADRRKDTTTAVRPTIAVAPVINIETLVKPAQNPVQKPAPKGTVKPAPKSTAATAPQTSEATKRAVCTAVKDLKLNPSDYSAIYRAFAEAKSPQDLHGLLSKAIKTQGQKGYPLVKEIHLQTV